MNTDTGDGDMILQRCLNLQRRLKLQRRLSAGLRAPRHAWSHTLRPHNAKASRTMATQPFRERIRAAIGVANTTTKPRSPKRSPSDRETLLRVRHQANSRFLTECYLFPAALLSARCPKIVQSTKSGVSRDARFGGARQNKASRFE